MMLIYKKTEVSHTQNAYLFANQKNDTAIEYLCTEDEIEKLKDVLPCKEVFERPKGYKILPRSEEDRFFWEV